MLEHYPFINTPLPYAYDALEPYIDRQTLHFHHDKHLQAYTDNLNDALRRNPSLQEMTLEQLICISGRLSKEVGVPVSRNAGGVYNHRFYFDGMASSIGQKPGLALSKAINRSFGSFEAFRDKFTTAALSVFGSGYAWLLSDHCGRLRIVTSGNQETPLLQGECPILNIDVWEHAYYLEYQNRRGEYIDNWWNVVNWAEVDKRYYDCHNCRL